LQSIDPVWLFGAIALAAGVLLGMLLNRLFNPAVSDVDKLKAELAQERAEAERYKANVNSHFNKTSELVNELTQDYVKVYQHLAEGAQTLSDTREFTQVLEQSRGRVLISVDNEAPAQESSAVEATADEMPERVAAGIAGAADASPAVTDGQEDAAVAGDGQRQAAATDDVETGIEEREQSAADNGNDDAGQASRETPDSDQAAVAADESGTDSSRKV
jgi:hypothetical protein